MRRIALLLALCTVACTGEDPSGEEVRFQGVSNFSLDDVATCVSQDINSVFPRLFPTEEGSNHKAFHSYNGLAIDLKRLDKSVSLELRWDQPLDSSQEEYLRFCLERAYEAR